MFEQFIWYLKGYVRIRVSGYSPERFLNACRYKNIYIWDLKRVCGAYEMNLSVSGFRRLKEIIRKTGTKVCIIRRSGLPFLFTATGNVIYCFLDLFSVFVLSCL